MRSKGLFWEQVNALEKRLLEEAFTKCKGNLAEMCRVLGVNRQTLYNKLAVHGVGKK